MGFRQFSPYILTLKEKANAVRANKMLGIGQELGQRGASPRSDDIKRLGEDIFHPHMLDQDREFHAQGCGLEEIAFLGGGFEQGHSCFVPQHFCQDQPRKPGSGAQVRDRSDLCGDQGRQLGRIPEVPPPQVFQRPSRNQIMAGVPVFEQPCIGLQPGQCFT